MFMYHIQSKPDKFRCLRTPKLPEPIWSWSNTKCWISSNLLLFNYGIELIWRARTSLPRKFKTAPISTMELNLSEEQELSCWIIANQLLFTNKTELFQKQTHLDTCKCRVSITIHNKFRWPWMNKTASPKRNQLSLKREREREKKKGEGGIALIRHGEPVGPK